MDFNQDFAQHSTRLTSGSREPNHYDLAVVDFDSINENENSFFDEDCFDFNAETETPDHFSLRSKKKQAARQERRMNRISNKQDRKDLRADRKNARKSRGEMQAEQTQGASDIQNVSAQTGVQPSTVALANVAANQPLVASYVEQKGYTPQSNPAALALQASSIFNEDVEDRMNEDGINDWETAKDSVIEDEQDSWGEPADEFFGTILTSVFAAGKALVDKINEKRKKNGKKPLFGGKGWQKLAQKVADNQDVVTDAMTASEKAFMALTKKEITEAKQKTPIGAAKDAFVDDQTKQAIKQYLPLGIAVLVLVFIIGKHS